MGESRIDKAVARIEAALARMDAARASALGERPANGPVTGSVTSSETAEKDAGGSARVMELVNRHEKLREEVADSLRDLDALIGELEG